MFISGSLESFLLVFIKLFFARCYSWGATGENRSKIGDFAPTRLFDPKFQIEGVAPPIIFARIVRPMNALQLCLWQFSHKETLYQTFFKRSAILRPFCVLWPLWGLGATYEDHLRFIGKRVVDFLLVLNVSWTFFARCYGWYSNSIVHV